MVINTYNKITKPTTIWKLVFQEKNPLETAIAKTTPTGASLKKSFSVLGSLSRGFFAMENFLRTFFLIFNFEAGFGNPHLGQVLASVETAFPHSLQFDIAITHYPTTICDYI